MLAFDLQNEVFVSGSCVAKTPTLLRFGLPMF
jgi:hypothetical protein